MHLDRQHSYWAKSQAIKYTLRPIKILFHKVLHNKEHVLRQLLQPVASTHSYSRRTRRIKDKWRRLLGTCIETLPQLNSLHA